jgi:hypothetical protein
MVVAKSGIRLRLPGVVFEGALVIEPGTLSGTVDDFCSVFVSLNLTWERAAMRWKLANKFVASNPACADALRPAQGEIT